MSIERGAFHPQAMAKSEERKRVQRPGSRGGKYWIDKHGIARYGAKKITNENLVRYIENMPDAARSALQEYLNEHLENPKIDLMVYMRLKDILKELNYVDEREGMVHKVRSKSNAQFIPLDEDWHAKMRKPTEPSNIVVPKKENYFINPEAAEVADQGGFMAVANEDLTVAGLKAKMKEWNDSQDGVEAYIYDLTKRQLEAKGADMPKEIRRKPAPGEVKNEASAFSPVTIKPKARILEMNQYASTGNIKDFSLSDFDASKVKGGDSEASRAFLGDSGRIKEVDENAKPALGNVWFKEDPITGKLKLWRANYDTSD